jgi:hypothetical protein
MNSNKNNAELFQISYPITQQPPRIEDIEDMIQLYKPEGVGLIELARHDSLTVERIPNFNEG